MKRFFQAALLVAATAVVPLASAQPNMVGVWVQDGVGAGAYVGKTNSDHYENKGGGAREYTDQPHRKWRLEVTEQNGRALHGNWCSEKSCESTVGAFRGNGDLLLADEDGLFIGSVDAGTLELCYLEAGEGHQVVSCWNFKKQ